MSLCGHFEAEVYVVSSIRRFAPLTRGYAWCRPFVAQAWRELVLQAPVQMQICAQCKRDLHWAQIDLHPAQAGLAPGVGRCASVGRVFLFAAL